MVYMTLTGRTESNKAASAIAAQVMAAMSPALQMGAAGEIRAECQEIVDSIIEAAVYETLLRIENRNRKPL